MKIYDLKVNGITNPVGFSFEQILCSWKVTETSAKKQIKARIDVSKDPGFSEIIAGEEGDLACNETEIRLDPEPYTTYYWRVYVEGDNGESALSDTAVFETAKMDEPWQAKWIGPSAEDTFHPVLKKKFSFEGKVKRARLYICGVGLYEAYVNGKKAGNEFLAPFINDYNECLQYETYDITEDVKAQNTIEIYLAKGWYMGTFGLDLKDKNWGERMAAIAEIRIEDEDGNISVASTDESWLYHGSDTEESGIYFGEILNRQLWKDKENPWKAACAVEIPYVLKERYSLPVIVKEEITPAEVIHTPAGETVIDMGQNHSGIMQFEADFPAGTKITMQCGEVLQQGNFYHDNYRDAETVFVYVSDGRKETVRAHFTYYGYRYLKVEGWPGELKKEDIKSLVIYSDLERTGYIETSNEKINRLYENCIWGQKSNFLDMPTDCPQRSERLGWTGDAQVFTPTASYNMDTRAFMRKYLKDLRSDQIRCGGGVANFIPNLEGGAAGCSIWGDVITFIPEYLYEKFGNIKEMENYYPGMKDWVDYMHAKASEAGNEFLYNPPFQFGDWLALDGITDQSFKGATDDGYLGGICYYQSTKLVSDMAARLGKNEDAAQYKALADKIKEAVLYTYFAPGGRITVDTQAAYILALKFGVYTNKEVLLAQFKDRLKRDRYEIKCGFAGAPLLCVTLCENGMADEAYRFLFKENFPSWLYCVNLGATTIWERWNSLLEDGTCSGTGMNSFNHYSYGSVVEFLYAYIAGIRALEPGFKKTLIAPLPNMKFRYFNCSYDSVYGKYVSNWSVAQDGRFAMHIEIPFNCSAQVVCPRFDRASASAAVDIPDNGMVTLEAGTYDISYMPSEDYRKIYNADTRIAELKGDDEAMEILKEELPAAYGIVVSGDPENSNLTFKELGFQFFMGFNPELVAKGSRRIFELVRY